MLPSRCTLGESFCQVCVMHQKDKDKEKVFLKDKTKLPPPFHFGNVPDKLEGEVVPHFGKDYILHWTLSRWKIPGHLSLTRTSQWHLWHLRLHLLRSVTTFDHLIFHFLPNAQSFDRFSLSCHEINFPRYLTPSEFLLCAAESTCRLDCQVPFPLQSKIRLTVR